MQDVCDGHDTRQLVCRSNEGIFPKFPLLGP